MTSPSAFDIIACAVALILLGILAYGSVVNNWAIWKRRYEDRKSRRDWRRWL